MELDIIKEQVNKLQQNTIGELNNQKQIGEVAIIKHKVLAELKIFFKEIPLFDREKRPGLVEFLNEKKDMFNSLFKNKVKALEEAQNQYDEFLFYKTSLGSSHIIPYYIRKIKSIFIQLGFEFFDAPEIDSEYRNFTALNVAEKHPCRDDHQSFFLEKGLLRTHTSNIHSYILEQNKSQCFTVGRVYRRDLDATHTPMFHQIEVVNVNAKANVMALMTMLKTFLCNFFEVENVEIRLRPSFFPFTEPSYEIDMLWGSKWLEILGAGIMHPNLFRFAKKTPSTAYAFGCGLERLIMIKHNIKDIRDLYTQNNFVAKNTGVKYD